MVGTGQMPYERVDPATVKPGDRLPVRVGGVEYDTVISPNGVHRFVEDPANPLLLRIRDHGCGGNPNGDISDLNDAARRYCQQEFTQREYAELNMAMGYSIAGFCDLTSFQDMDIDNPLWEAPDYPDPSTIKDFAFQLTSAAVKVFVAILEAGSEELNNAVHGTNEARAEARAVVELLIDGMK